MKKLIAFLLFAVTFGVQLELKAQTIKDIISPLTTNFYGVNCWVGSAWLTEPIEGESANKSQPHYRYGFSVKFGPLKLWKKNVETLKYDTVWEYKTHHMKSIWDTMSVGYEVTNEIKKRQEYVIKAPINFGYQSTTGVTFESENIEVKPFNISSFFASTILTFTPFKDDALGLCIGMSFSFDELKDIQSNYRDSLGSTHPIQFSSKQILSPELIAGLSFEFEDRGVIFADVSYKSAVFNSIKYLSLSTKVSTETLQETLRKEFDFSMWSIKCGISLTMN